ncbi:ATP-binding protein [Ulvibacterium sp.]|uniref:tetratricopeptide repeat-containing sensor histidine kinase n=1 Tax=Ulvibacterium sp. TaxID=2665914 RepID=UPI00262BC510|nr:ATP-binding protein [Ulvibacterium sp.]
MICKYVLLLGAVFFISFINPRDSTPEENPAVLSTQDSILTWIEEGRNSTYTREKRADFLRKAYGEAKREVKDSLKTKYFSRLSLAYQQLPDSMLFRETNRRTLQLAQKTKDSVVQAEANWDLAIFYRSTAIPDSSYYHFAEAHKLFKALNNDFFAARMLYNMAVVQADVKDYTGSEITTIRAIELLKPLDKYRQLYNCYNNLGVITKDLREYQRAISYFDMALDYLSKLDEENTLNYEILNNIGTVYQEQDLHEEAISYFQKIVESDDLFEEDKSLYALALNNMAYSKLQLAEYNELPSLFERAIGIQDSLRNIVGLSLSYYNMAEYYLSKGDTVQAMTQAQKARTYSEQSSNNERLLQTLQLMARLEPKNALQYTQRYMVLNDSLIQEERKARNKFARIRFETDEFIAENEILTREKQLWAGIAVGLLLLGLAIYIIVDQRAKNQKLRFQQQQQASNQEIFNLMLSQKQKVEEGKKMEQKRISEELHDGVLGKMLGARMLLTGLNKKADEDAIAQRARAISALQEVEGEVRSISHELSHAAYQKIHNFIHSIEDLLKSLQENTSIAHNFRYDDAVDWDGLTGDIKINLYRMVQETLQNSVKHAQCKNVSVDFAKQGDDLLITIADDGQGFSTKRGKKGIGMRNIASRIEKLGGSWDITSVKGKGTTVLFRIPTEEPNTFESNNEQRELEEVKTA